MCICAQRPYIVKRNRAVACTPKKPFDNGADSQYIGSMAKLTPLAKNLRRLRESRDWSPLDVARESGLAHTTIIRIESGEIRSPRLRVLEKLGITFGLSVTELITVASQSRETHTA